LPRRFCFSATSRLAIITHDGYFLAATLRRNLHGWILTYSLKLVALGGAITSSLFTAQAADGADFDDVLHAGSRTTSISKTSLPDVLLLTFDDFQRQRRCRRWAQARRKSAWRT